MGVPAFRQTAHGDPGHVYPRPVRARPRRHADRRSISVQCTSKSRESLSRSCGSQSNIPSTCGRGRNGRLRRSNRFDYSQSLESAQSKVGPSRRVLVNVSCCGKGDRRGSGTVPNPCSRRPVNCDQSHRTRIRPTFCREHNSPVPLMVRSAPTEVGRMATNGDLMAISTVAEPGGLAAYCQFCYRFQYDSYYHRLGR